MNVRPVCIKENTITVAIVIDKIVLQPGGMPHVFRCAWQTGPTSLSM